MKRQFTDEVENIYLNALVYGSTGFGKTYSAQTLPDLDKTVVLSAESGLLPLRKKKIEVWTLDKWEDTDKAINFLEEKEQQEKFTNIFVDSLTEVTKMSCEQVLVERIGIVEARGKNLDQIFKDAMTQEDWGVAKGRSDRFVRRLRDLPYNVIMTALVTNKQMKDGQTKNAPLLSPGSLAEVVPGYFDEVFIMKQALSEKEGKDDEIVRWWETVDDGTQIAKDRTGNLDKTIAPDWTKIFNSLREE